MSNSLITDNFKQTKRGTQSSLKATTVKTEPSTSVSKADEDLEILKSFDLALEYGPCTGITRLQRWQRAEKHGLNPPRSVYDILQQHHDDENYTMNLWKDYDL